MDVDRGGVWRLGVGWRGVCGGDEVGGWSGGRGGEGSGERELVDEGNGGDVGGGGGGRA